MTQKKLSELTGIRAGTISALYHESAERFGFDQLDRICEVLDRSMGDMGELLEYIPNKHPHTGEILILEQHGNRKKKPC